MKKILKTFSGTTDPAVTDRELAGRALSRKAAAEGMVLLKNENHLLPLKKGSKIALYGSGAGKTVKGGTGSGDVNERETVNIVTGLKQNGFQVTTETWIDDYEETYRQSRFDWKNMILSESEGSDDMTSFFNTYASHPFMMPDPRLITDEDVRKSDTDTAVYVVSRIAGEAADRFVKKGDYYLTDVEMKNLRYVCEHYQHVIFIVNAGAQIDLSFTVNYPSIESILYMVQAGMEGGSALADILDGTVNPSGKLTDTWAWKYEDYPSSDTFSHNNGNIQKEYYTESIYVGYRYFDSFGIAPQYPFGFGLSYTDFFIEKADEPICIDTEKQTITVAAAVKNTGTIYAGKEVLQVYVSAPQSGQPKEYRRLCGYGKTSLLAPGETLKIDVSFPVKAIASFDERRSAWIAEKGLYGIWIGNSSRNLVLCGALKVAEDSVVEKVTHICPIKESLDELVRPEEPTRLFETSWHQTLIKENLPILNLVVHPEYVKHYAESKWLNKAKELAEQLTDDELLHMVIGEISKGQGSSGNALGSAGIAVPGAAGETSSVLDEKYDVPGLPMADGPAGLRLNQTYEVDRSTGSIIPNDPFSAFEGGYFVESVKHENCDTYYQYCTAIPVGTLLAQTWDKELIKNVGLMVGSEMLAFGVTWWLAPGMNIHRNPLCGRNFEYYSEDPVVSGNTAAAITMGIQSHPGIGTTIKHFACNNQEDNRYGSDSILSERTLREIYLKGFEIAVKTAQPMAIMTSYNLINGVHAANCKDTCTIAARKEWGFAGIIMTDWTTTSPFGGSISWKCMEAGNDLIMPGDVYDMENIRNSLKNGDLDRKDLKACVSRLISMAYQSNYFEGAKSYSEQFK